MMAGGLYCDRYSGASGPRLKSRSMALTDSLKPNLV